jgi:hypothetical protein
MSYQAVLSGLVQLALMLAVVSAYLALARRFRVLWNPFAILLSVIVVGVVVSVVGELIFRGGWAGVPALARRSAIGSLGWGVIIAAVVWIGRGMASWTRS